MQTKSILTLIALTVLGCADEVQNPWAGFQPFTSTYNPEQLSKVNSFTTEGKGVGLVSLKEASGLATSEANENALWIHNDSGGGNVVTLLDASTAKEKVSFTLSGIDNLDWEDIEVGPGPATGNSYLYIGDIGDNNLSRTQIRIYRLPEPLYAESMNGKTIVLQPQVDNIVLTYPDGPHNAETLLLDPTTKDLYVVTKNDAKSILYVARFPQSTTSPNALVHVGTFGFTEATAGDIDSNAGQIVVKNYEQIFYWENKANKPVWQVLASEPKLAPYNPVEAKGEAICFFKQGYFTVSELYNQGSVQLYHY